MPANRFNAFTDYGVGIGLRIPHYSHILEKKPTVDWFEIISENFMVDGGRPLAVLDRILEQYRVVQHGVALYFGSADKTDRGQLRRLKNLVKRTGVQPGNGRRHDDGTSRFVHGEFVIFWVSIPLRQTPCRPGAE